MEPTGSAEPTTVVAVCLGHRCRALLGRRQPEAMTALRDAARRSDRGVLMSTGCVGPCAYAPVAAVGTGAGAGGAFAVTTRALLGPVDTAELAALGHYLGTGSPAVLPPELAGVQLARLQPG